MTEMSPVLRTLHARTGENATPLHRRYRYTPTLADYERAARVLLRDTEAVRLRVETRMAELREHEQRARALMCVAPLPCSFE
ncbi:hypothetical protein PQR34_45385 [Paraburkholderia sediminicola]|uniref:hypothetical protein n=1 Tax=Paraburkholderia sediminicola TaxID=458836 RepID=UPI0038B853CA